MPAAIRRARILERIERDGGVSVAELARVYGVSAVTIHRDLERLASEGLVERVHGGARATTRLNGRLPSPATQQGYTSVQPSGADALIAERAAREVLDGATVFLDASATAVALARRLAGEPPRGLTIVTNAPAIALGETGSIHTVVCPGELHRDVRALGGRWTVEFVSGLHFNVAFVSATGLTLEHGLTTARRELADVANAARASADRTIGLVQSASFGQASLLSVMPAGDLDLIITDPDLPDESASRYRAAGVSLEVTTTEERRA